LSLNLDTALRYYKQHGCIAFWNPRDVTDENLRTDIPDAEALLIEPTNISSYEAHEGHYLVQNAKLEPYESYPGHEGVDAVFEVLKGTSPDVRPTAAITECVSMQWVIMDKTGGENGIFFKPYEPPSAASQVAQPKAQPECSAASQTRRVKVGERFRTGRSRDRIVPEIRLSGRWLADAGFKIGDSVSIEVGNHELYIVRVDR
jgi:toxic protein SymE